MPHHDETTADRLAIAAQQMQLTAEHLTRGLTTADLPPLADYLCDLAEHGWSLATRALHAIDNTDPRHPAREDTNGGSLQVCLHHAANLFEAAQTMMSIAGEALKRMDTPT